MVVGSPTKLNLIPSGVMPVVYINQGDAGYDKEFLIYNGDSPYNVPAGVSATIRGKKADGYGVTEAAALTEDSNLVTVTITEQMVAAAGANLYELVFVDTDGLRIATINMVWAVKQDALGGAVISDSDLDYATQVMDELQSVQAFKNQLDTNTAAIGTEAIARASMDNALQNSIEAEAAAREAAVSNEATARASADQNLQNQINQIVAPSGSAPSAAEVTDARIGADGTTYPSLGDAIRTQISDVSTLIERSLIPKQTYITFTKQSGKRWQYYDNFNLIDASGYFACSFDADENQEYDIYARNIGTNTTFAIAYFAGTTLISSVSNLPASAEHLARITTPTGCTSVRFTTNNESQPIIRVLKNGYVTKENPPLYVSMSGSDTWDGSESHPYQSIQKAINEGTSDTIIIAAGRYQTPISAANRRKLHIIGDIAGGTVIDYSVTVTPSAGDSGLLEFAYASTATDPIYRVFISKDLPLYTQGNSTAYTVNLWSFDGSTLLVPKLTLEEVQNTAGTWTYDGSKLYINGDASAYKLVPTFEDIGGAFSNIQELTIENVSFKFSGYTNCSVINCNDVKIDNCEFSAAGRQHGLAFSNSNAVVRKCTALRNCYDGFNIHNKGDVSFIDCESGYNRDDGMSHHDGSTGTVIGGRYHHNHKGGIAPTYDSPVNIFAAECSANGYGIYYATATKTITGTINGCLLVNNNGYGLRVAGTYQITAVACLYSGNNANSKADGGGVIWSFGGNA